MKEIKINEIEGFKIGNAEDLNGGTGCTAIICEEGAVAGCDVRGGGPASRETELLRPEKLVQKIHCVMLSGGSAYGLAAGDGAMKYLEEKNVGFNVGIGVVPIVCGASLFDLVVGNPKIRPDREMGYLACKNAEKNAPEMGCVGAGTGASVGKFLGVDRMMKSGIGFYAAEVGGVKVGAIAAVNALGNIYNAETGEAIAGILSEDGNSVISTEDAMLAAVAENKNVFADNKDIVTNTTISCVITNAKLTKSEANKLASICHNAYARVIKPVHTSADGDTIFTMSTDKVDVSADIVGVMAVKVLEKAINNAVFNAKSMYSLKAFSDIK